MLKTIGIIVVVFFVVIAAVLVHAATRPDSFRVERAASIKAPPDRIFAFINDLHEHAAWSPWEKKDPGMKRDHSGAPNGKGAIYAWDGNKDIGAGRMEITESSPPSRIVAKLDFVRPFEAHNMVEFTLRPDGDSTTVTCAIYGSSPFVSKVMGLFFSMDRMIGNEFDAGLASLKALAEKQAGQPRQ